MSLRRDRLNAPRWANAILEKKYFFYASLALNVLLALLYLRATINFKWSNNTDRLHSTALKWNGGHPATSQFGSCFCSDFDKYCMCTPSLAIDLVIASGENHVWLVRRKDTDQLATMGGFVEIGETVEHAVKRELKEETGIELTSQPMLLGVYTDPRRDNRRHTASAVFAIQLDGTETPRAADDVKAVTRIHLNDIENHTYFADHMTILLDYRALKRNEKFSKTTPLDFSDNIVRSVCNLDGFNR
jgi:8-oxo-dGTP diphosphatase